MKKKQLNVDFDAAQFWPQPKSYLIDPEIPKGALIQLRGKSLPVCSCGNNCRDGIGRLIVPWLKQMGDAKNRIMYLQGNRITELFGNIISFDVSLANLPELENSVIRSEEHT